MRPQAPRPFGKLDAAIVAFGLLLGVWAAWQWQTHDPWILESALGLAPSIPFPVPDSPGWLSPVRDLLPIVLAPTTLALAFATFRRPLGTGRRAIRAPGVAATAVAAVITALVLANEYILRRFFESRVQFLDPITFLWDGLGIRVGLAVLVLWSLMALGGRWRARPHAWDRLGRFLSFAWLGYMAWIEWLVWFVKKSIY